MTDSAGGESAPSDVAPCPTCGQPVTADQRFCAACGAKLSDPAVGPQASFQPMSPAPPGAGEPADTDYPPNNKLVAGLLTIFFPFISLIVALVMRSSERMSLRRASLRTWAIASGAWLAVGALIFIIVAASASHAVSNNQPSSKGPCQGGPETGASGTPLGNGKYRFPCEFGGSTVVNFGS
jgi:hypothetical protein